MNTFFHKHIASRAGRWGRFLRGLGAGCSEALRVLTLDGVRPCELTRAMSKRELEKKLLAQGYSRKLAKIAVSGAIPDRNPLL